MPITSNGYYNDPALAQAFGNLGKMFEPPSGEQLAGYALANQRTQAASRLSALFDYAKDPNFNQGQFDRLGVASGAWNPNQSYYSVDANQQGETTRKLLDPVGANQTRYVPPTLAHLYGIDPQQRGIVTLNQGEQATLPSGQVLSGAEKPLTVAEVKGKVLQGLPQATQEAATLSDIPVESVVLGGRPQVVRRSDAVGQTPYSAADSELVEGTANIGGANVSVFRPKTGTTYKTADGTPVPAGVQVFEKARPTGTNDQVGLGKATESGDKAGMFYSRAAVANSNMNGEMAGGYMPSVKDYELALGVGDKVPTSIANSMISDQGRRFYSNGMNFMMSVLRPDTGAAFGKQEFASYARIFLPLPGDDPQTLQDKAVARETALAALQGTSRGAAAQITKIMQANGVPVPPEMAAHIQAAQGVQAPPAGGAHPAAPGPGLAPPARPPNAQAVQALKANPALAAQFDQKYGAGSAAHALGGQ